MLLLLNQHSVTQTEANGTLPQKKKVDLIYNTTLVCPWDCAVCCVDAILVKKIGHELKIRSHGLDKTETFPLDKTYPNIDLDPIWWTHRRQIKRINFITF